ncbi:uncharacterized protein [Henckelia pumila]|uniref:uncharacterized protein n=1 Tax=Henckelia pumila TaxID=405737 RepID=UPI003C6DD7B7
MEFYSNFIDLCFFPAHAKFSFSRRVDLPFFSSQSLTKFQVISWVEFEIIWYGACMKRSSENKQLLSAALFSIVYMHGRVTDSSTIVSYQRKRQLRNEAAGFDIIRSGH